MVPGVQHGIIPGLDSASGSGIIIPGVIRRNGVQQSALTQSPVVGGSGGAGKNQYGKQKQDSDHAAEKNGARHGANLLFNSCSVFYPLCSHYRNESKRFFLANKKGTIRPVSIVPMFLLLEAIHLRRRFLHNGRNDNVSAAIYSLHHISGVYIIMNCEL